MSPLSLRSAYIVCRSVASGAAVAPCGGVTLTETTRRETDLLQPGPEA